MQLALIKYLFGHMDKKGLNTAPKMRLNVAVIHGLGKVSSDILCYVATIFDK